MAVNANLLHSEFDTMVLALDLSIILLLHEK